MEDKIKKEHYPFAYNGETNAAPDPGHGVENFKIGNFAAVEFQVQAKDMPAAANFTGNRNQRQIELRSLLDTGATGIAFINATMARNVCETLEISIIKLAKPKRLKGFDGQTLLLPLLTLSTPRSLCRITPEN